MWYMNLPFSDMYLWRLPYFKLSNASTNLPNTSLLLLLTLAVVRCSPFIILLHMNLVVVVSKLEDLRPILRCCTFIHIVRSPSILIQLPLSHWSFRLRFSFDLILQLSLHPLRVSFNYNKQWVIHQLVVAKKFNVMVYFFHYWYSILVLKA